MEPSDSLTSTTIIDRNETRPEAERVLEAGHYIEVEVVGGPMDGEKRRLAKACMTIGRGEMNDLPLRLDPTISMRHARIVREGQHFWLEDLESSNGTFIGDKQIRERTLIGAGGEFMVGHTSIELLPY